MSAVVVGYIPTPQGRAALRRGTEEARLRQARLVVVNATRGDALVDDRYLQGAAAAELRDELSTLEVPAELRQVSDGEDVSTALDRVAEEVGADLVVIGIRHRTPVGKLILGSAATRILLHLRQPVLAVKV